MQSQAYQEQIQRKIKSSYSKLVSIPTTSLTITNKCKSRSVQQKQPETDLTNNEADQTAEIPIEQCYLSQEGLPIIIEQDHFIGNCICYLCTCQQHQCPADFLELRIRHKGTRHSTYGQDFTASQFKPSPYLKHPVRQQQLIRSNSPMDLQTTYGQSFQQKTAEQVTPVKKPDNIHFRGHQKLKSYYQQEFPNWGVSDTYIAKKPQVSYKRNKLKFYSQSSYKSEFTEKLSLSGKMLKPINRKTFDILNPHHTPNFDTTHSREFYAKTPTPSVNWSFRHKYQEERSPSRKLISQYNREFNQSPMRFIPRKRHLRNY